MSSRLNGRALFGTSLVVAVLLIGVGVGIEPRSDPPPKVPAGAVRLTVGGPLRSRPVPAGFIGYSFEFYGVEGYTGDDPSAVNPVLVRLTRNLDPNQPFVLRIGGDSTDWTWWPIKGAARPPGVTYDLSPRWIQVVNAFANAVGGRLILGINLEENNPQLASVEARQLLAGLGSKHVYGLELGNEPELFSTFTYYTLPNGTKVNGRPHGYGMQDYTNEFIRFAKALPPTPLVGPATGAPEWRAKPKLKIFLSQAPRLSVVTVHRYPLANCFTPPSAPQYPTLKHLLSTFATTGLANGVAEAIQVSHSYGLPLRLDELNSVACSGRAGLSNTFASALWVLDALAELVRVNADGINIHTFPTARYGLFTFQRSHGVWQASVRPEYYGLLMFTQAAPPGARLTRLSWTTNGPIRAWATRAPDGTRHVVLINFSPKSPRTIAIKVPGASGDAILERLWAPFLLAKHHITLGGQSFGMQSSTGSLAGSPEMPQVRPALGGYYVVRVPGASAAMLTLPSS